jgi:hypothetical protein
MVYMLATIFRNLLVDFTELYPLKDHDAFRDEWNDLVQRWNVFMPGDDARKKLEHDGLLAMDIATYKKLNMGADEDGVGATSDGDRGNEEDDDDVQNAVEEILITSF